MQRRFFATRRDDPDRTRILDMLRDQEKLVNDVVVVVMARRQQNNGTKSEREVFFLDVAEMLRLQKIWIQNNGGRWTTGPAKEAEAKVDKQLRLWDEQRAEEQRKRIESELNKQKSLFDETDC